MGEARRRKMSDPHYGEPELFSTNLNGKNLKVRTKLHEGFLTLIQDNECVIEMEGSDDEVDLLENILSFTLETVLAKYNHAKIKYKFYFDLRRIKTNYSGFLKIYPKYWDDTAGQIRDFRAVEIKLKPASETPQSELERLSPKEHIRKAHKRRSLRKWVEIPETLVNPG